MGYSLLLNLHEILKDGIGTVVKEVAARRTARNRNKKSDKVYSIPPIPNGFISTSVRLACALNIFWGGAPDDIMIKYGVSHTKVLDSVLYVYEAINLLTKFCISYPSNFNEQKAIVAGFKKASSVGFMNCTSCIHGILIWIHKPTVKEVETASIGRKKFFMNINTSLVSIVKQ